MPITNNEVIATLNDLIEVCKDGQEGFRAAAERVSESDIKNMFYQYSQQRAQFAGELQAEVHSLGGEPEKSGSVFVDAAAGNHLDAARNRADLSGRAANGELRRRARLAGGVRGFAVHGAPVSGARQRRRRQCFGAVEPTEIVPPTPRQAEAIYDERFSIEHAIRFSKQELGLVSGQFNRLAAEGREQTWVALVATAYWLRWALRGVVDEEKATWPAWWRSRKLTPGAMRRLAAGLFLGLGWSKPAVKPRGKSPGRAAGARQEPRTRFKVYRAEA